MPFIIRNDLVEELTYEQLWEWQRNLSYISDRRWWSRRGSAENALAAQNVYSRPPITSVPGAITTDVLQAIRNTQTEIPMPTPVPTPPSPPSASTNEFVDINIKPVATSDGVSNKFQISFEMNMPRFAGMISPKQIEDVFKQQSQVYLTSAIGKMIEEESFADILKPKLREHLINLPLSEIMTLTNLDIGGILELLT